MLVSVKEYSSIEIYQSQEVVQLSLCEVINTNKRIVNKAELSDGYLRSRILVDITPQRLLGGYYPQIVRSRPR